MWLCMNLQKAALGIIYTAETAVIVEFTTNIDKTSDDKRTFLSSSLHCHHQQHKLF